MWLLTWRTCLTFLSERLKISLGTLPLTFKLQGEWYDMIDKTDDRLKSLYNYAQPSLVSLPSLCSSPLFPSLTPVSKPPTFSFSPPPLSSFPLTSLLHQSPSSPLPSSTLPLPFSLLYPPSSLHHPLSSPLLPSLPPTHLGSRVSLGSRLFFSSKVKPVGSSR